MASIESINPETHIMQSHYSSKDIAGIQTPESNVQTIYAGAHITIKLCNYRLI